MQELSGKVAVVTGAASGIGRAMALALAGEGMRLAVLDVDRPAVDETAEMITAAGGSALSLVCDVSVRDEVNACAEKVFDHYGSVHVLCNNAGVTSFKLVTEMTEADWDWIIGVDLWSVIYGYHAYLPRMIAQGEEGHVVNTSSGIGVVPDMLPGHTAYAAAKGAAVALASSLRVELADTGIGVSVVCPGMVNTQILNSGRTRPERFGGPQNETANVPGRPNPLDGAADPDDVAAAVVDAIKTNRHFVFPQKEIRDQVVDYYQRMINDF